VSKLLVLRPRADADIDDLVRWLLAESPQSATVFLDQIETAFERLSCFPDSGSPRHAPLVPGLPVPLRYLAVSAARFPKLLIYYLNLEAQLDVIRIWDASRGLDALFEGEDFS